MVDHIDVHIGSRLRRTRQFRGLSQKQLAQALGLSVQSLDNFERGVTRLTAAVMSAAARRLNVDASFFFKGLKVAESVAGDRVEAEPSVRKDNVYLFRPRRPDGKLFVNGGA